MTKKKTTVTRNGCQHTPHVMSQELKRKWVPKTVAVGEMGDI